ncbi:hypothetical protein HFN63_36830 [Rhizobium leguminosarum]|uniref:hypothetical protein n=1 Tax=Rhizobium leguminosarum TaxID=384 RepID=UPI001C9788A2|nr:hypothetical protein [Rhizobium leguminosarum]MBY5775480.1 hypothetical protein [Rhizobium leguminosarum]
MTNLQKKKRGLEEGGDELSKRRRLNSKADGSRKTPITNLANDHLDIIISYVALAKEEGTAAKDLRSCESIPIFQAAVLRGRARGVYQALNEATEAAERNYEALPPVFDEAGPVAPHNYLKMVGDGVHLLKGAHEVEVVDRTVGIKSPGTKASALDVAASYEFSRESKIRLLGSAIDLLRKPDEGHIRNAARAVAMLYDVSTDAQKGEIAALPSRVKVLIDEFGEDERTGNRTAERSPLNEEQQEPQMVAVFRATEELRAKLQSARVARAALANRNREKSRGTGL